MPEFDEDPSGTTQQFRAFAQHEQADNPAPWHMRAPGSRVLLLAAAVIVAAAVVGAIALSVAG